MKSKAWIWKGSPEPKDLSMEEKTIRNLQEDEVLVKNSFIGLNPVDWKLINHLYPKEKIGIVPGVDGAGIVVGVGNDMKKIRTGTRVCYHTDLNQDGSFSDFTIVKGHRVMYIPDRVSDITAAAFPCPGLTAWQGFSKLPKVKGGDILVNGAGGMVGNIITQLAVKAGARVYVTASPKHHPDLYNKGVVSAIDYKVENWKSALIQQLHERKLYAIFDMVSGKSATGLTDLLGYYGHIVSIQDRIDKNPIPPFTTSISLHEIALAAFHQYASDTQIAELMKDGEELLNQIGNNILNVAIPKVEIFSKLNLALQKLKENPSVGKTVIEI